jgi:hypothetical protein
MQMSDLEIMYEFENELCMSGVKRNCCDNFEVIYYDLVKMHVYNGSTQKIMKWEAYKNYFKNLNRYPRGY